MPGHTKCCTCDAKSFQQTWRSDASKCNPSQKISARTSNNSDEHISCNVHATENASLQILFKYPMLTIVFEMLQNPHVFLLTFDKVHNPLHLPRETISESPKVVRTHGNYKILKSTCASRHNAVHFFDISTSKNGPNMRWFLKIFIYKCASRHNGLHFFDVATSKRGPTIACFVNFNFQIFFAPQRRALFRHLNFQKWCEREVFLFFLFRNVLRATTACTFSTSQLPKVVRPWCVLYILISTCVFAPQRRALFRHLNFQKWSEPHFDLETRFEPQWRAFFHLSSGQMAPRPPLKRAYFSTLRSRKSLENHNVLRFS